MKRANVPNALGMRYEFVRWLIVMLLSRGFMDLAYIGRQQVESTLVALGIEIIGIYLIVIWFKRPISCLSCSTQMLSSSMGYLLMTSWTSSRNPRDISWLLTGYMKLWLTGLKNGRGLQCLDEEAWTWSKLRSQITHVVSKYGEKNDSKINEYGLLSEQLEVVLQIAAAMMYLHDKASQYRIRCLRGCETVPTLA